MWLQSCFDNNLKTQPPWVHLLLYVGLFSLLKHSFSLINWIFISFLRPPKNLKTTYGPWALITGPTEGIGKAFAFQLARNGLNLILVGRNFEKLTRVAGEIQAEYPDTRIEKVVVDFSGDVAGGVRRMEAAIEGLEVGVLVNNVGVTYPEAMYFHEVVEEVWMKVVNVNLRGTTFVTRAVIKGMIQRKRGAIVNIGSAVSVVIPSHPLYAIYAATKAYIDRLSRSLSVEYKHSGIHVQCQIPLYVSTEMTRKVASIERPSLLVPSAQDYARAAVRRIGYESQCTPHMMHAFQWWFFSILPETLVSSWRLSVAIRRRAGAS